MVEGDRSRAKKAHIQGLSEPSETCISWVPYYSFHICACTRKHVNQFGVRQGIRHPAPPGYWGKHFYQFFSSLVLHPNHLHN